MKGILKPIFDMITGDFKVYDGVIENYYAMAFIGLVAFLIAYWIVGLLYSDGAIEGSILGSILHWGIRIVVFIVVFNAFLAVASLVRFIIAMPMWQVISALIMLISIGYFIIKRSSYW